MREATARINWLEVAEHSEKRRNRWRTKRGRHRSLRLHRTLCVSEGDVHRQVSVKAVNFSVENVEVKWCHFVCHTGLSKSRSDGLKFLETG